MPAKNTDLHGSAPDSCPVALLLIDVINDLEWEGGEELFKYALPMAQHIAELKRRARKLGIPAIYVNDNFGKWQSDFRKLIHHCLEDDVRGRPIVELLRPDDDDYFVLKPKQSGFFSTTLDTLLKHLQVNTVILTGVAGNICVVFTAHDAYMRDIHLYVPRNCVASNDRTANDHALHHMQAVLKADVTPSTELDLEAILRDAQEEKDSVAA